MCPVGDLWALTLAFKSEKETSVLEMYKTV